MLLRRDALAAIGGFDSVRDILAEDYITGARLTQAGRVVALSSHRLAVVTGSSTVAHFFNRHVRWGQMRRTIAPVFFFLELSANPTPFLLVLALVSDERLRALALMAQAAKWGLDAVVYLCLSLEPSGRTLALMPLKDCLVPVMWVTSALKRTVHWRGHRMLVGPGSRLLPLDSVRQREAELERPA
jgi:ceramide glucosyltransferase